MSERAVLYPTEEQYDRWKDRAEEMNYDSYSLFMADMIEAGMKKFDIAVTPDETNRELREQRNDLRDELEQARERISALEEQLYSGERKKIIEFVTKEPRTSGEIMQEVIDTAPSRIKRQLTELQGDELTKVNNQYHVTDNE